MLPAYVEYYKPTTLQEAVNLFQTLKQDDKQPMYWSGGTEILTLGRLNIDTPGSIIDIKGIPECMVLQTSSPFLTIGASVPLTALENRNIFPLLADVSSEVADRTSRNKITIGGNICGKIFYREAILPFLLANSHVLVADMQGVKEVPITELILEEGRLLVQILTDTDFLQLPYISRKIRKQWDTGYPLITGAAVKADGQLRLAFSGLCPFPFRSSAMETAINRTGLSFASRVEHTLQQVPDPILDDIEGSREYRLFVLRNMLMDFIMEMEGA
ncbi:CO/xanthine dehydrogenase FAD-binding subunit [Bacillus thermophilus]|uniref:CO/xanthine dehydrogenase FAD-binding subunit n=1 Tax=Siminovitchia thermophila TaxID=1245522 RepID=A0ABS2R944_9BACI|nr:FAD binding domain-containing protein [Siminovitchia thermophila]MBM7716129.1 CO/xanthine dehydrogenase FAD-binding subunit [Siminovitchia thermophila]ONK22423.1 xanthine dehydrogenase [Bacillus sp. VT-16-64]